MSLLLFMAQLYTGKSAHLPRWPSFACCDGSGLGKPVAIRCQAPYSFARITLTRREAERDHDSESTYRSQTENKSLFKSSVLQEPVGLDFPNNKLTFLSAFMHNTPLQNYPQQIPAVFSFRPSAPHWGCCYKFPYPLVMMLLFLFKD